MSPVSSCAHQTPLHRFDLSKVTCAPVVSPSGQYVPLFHAFFRCLDVYLPAELAVDSLRGRVYEVNLADLNLDEDQGFRKIKLQCEEIQGRSCLTDFHGMNITRDKLCSLIRKWHSLIEAFVDVQTVDGYTLRMFCIAFTERR